MWLVTVLSSAYSNPITAHKLKVKVTVFFFFTWFTTSKYIPKVVEGLRLHTFHWLVPPTPISYTTTENTLWWMAALRFKIQLWEGEGRNRNLQAGTHILWNTGALGVEWNTRPDGAANLQFPWCLYTHTQIHNVNLTCTIANVWCSKFKSVDTFDSLPWLPWRLRRPCGSRRCSLC